MRQPRSFRRGFPGDGLSVGREPGAAVLGCLDSLGLVKRPVPTRRIEAGRSALPISLPKGVAGPPDHLIAYPAACRLLFAICEAVATASGGGRRQLRWICEDIRRDSAKELSRHRVVAWSSLPSYLRRYRCGQCFIRLITHRLRRPSHPLAAIVSPPRRSVVVRWSTEAFAKECDQDPRELFPYLAGTLPRPDAHVDGRPWRPAGLGKCCRSITYIVRGDRALDERQAAHVDSVHWFRVTRSLSSTLHGPHRFLRGHRRVPRFTINSRYRHPRRCSGSFLAVG
jgi:hypothetical protein